MIEFLKALFRDTTEKCHHLETKMHMHFAVLGDDRGRSERVVIRECLKCGKHIRRIW